LLGVAELAGRSLSDVVHAPQKVLMGAFVDWLFRQPVDGQPVTAEFEFVSAGQSTRCATRWVMLADASSNAAMVSFGPAEDTSGPRPTVVSAHLTPLVQTGRDHLNGVSMTVGTTLRQPVFGLSSVDRRVDQGHAGRPVLSIREREIMQLILDGNRISTIASSLFLSENTVRNHLKRVYRKLGVGSIGELRESFQTGRSDF
jgi:DNA-binding CsgD family transcriptional regulator